MKLERKKDQHFQKNRTLPMKNAKSIEAKMERRRNEGWSDGG